MKAVHLFLDVDMRCNHPGLTEMALKAKVDLQTLRPGEAVIFMNGSKTKIKAFGCNGVISYVRADKGVKPSTLDSFVDAVLPGQKMVLTQKFRVNLFKALGLKVTDIKAA